MPNKKDETTTKFKVDISELKKNIIEANRLIRLNNSEFKAASAGMDKWSDNANGLTAKLKQLNGNLEQEKVKLKTLEEQYKLVAEAQGKDSKGAQDLIVKINNQKAAVEKNKAQIEKYEQALKDVNAAEKSSQTEYAKLNAEIDKQSAALNEIKTKYKNAVIAEGAASEKAKNLKSEFNKLNVELQKNKKKVEAADTAADNLSTSLGNAETAARDTKDGFTVARGAAANLASHGIGLVIEKVKDMITEIGNANTAYHNFETQTGISGGKLEKYKKQIDELYSEGVGEDISDIANSMAKVTQTSKETDPTKIKELTKNALTLKKEFGYEVIDTMRAVNMLMEQFGLNGQQAFSLIVQGTQNGLDKNGDMLDSINEYAVHYKQLGYSAKDFLNSLSNGTAAGTFSVDKLGDAMKEFGIRSKDTASSTVEGFKLLGYAAIPTQKEIDKVANNISKLEANLKYAKTEQAGFNEKTSELTRQKNADKIAKYTKELNSAKEELKAMNKASQGTKGTVTELQKRFAKGGKTAKKATQEVLKKLMDMDDEVEQNQAGVELFGTMWEDLGKDGVKALMNVNGKADETKDTMKKINDVAYDDVETELKKLGRTIQTKYIKPLIEKALPKIKEGMEWVENNLPEIESAAKPIAGIIASIFIGKKVAEFSGFVSNLITTFISLKNATQGATVAQKALNLAQSSNVIGLIVTAIGFAVTGFMSLSSEMDKNKNNAYQLSEKHKKLWETIDKETESYQKLKEEQKNQVEDVNGTFDYYTNLKDELQLICDKNGVIKKGYEKRAKVITDTLAPALGLEGQIVDGVILHYDSYMQKLDEVITKKKAIAMQSAYEEEYNTAVSKHVRQYSLYSDAVEAQKEADKKAGAAARIYDLKKGRLEKYTEQHPFAELEVTPEYRKLLDDATEAKKAMDEAKQTASDADKEVNAAQKTYLGYMNTINNYEQVTAAIQEGNVNKIKSAVNNLSNNFMTCENATETMLAQQVKNMRATYKDLQKAVEEGAPGVTQEMVNNAQSMVKKANYQLNKYKSKAREVGAEGTKAMADGIKEETPTVLENVGTSQAKAAKKAKESELKFEKVGQNASNKIASGIKQNSGKVSNAAQNTVRDAKTAGGNVNSKTVGVKFIDNILKGINAAKVSNKAKSTMSKAQGEAKKVQSKSVGTNFIQGIINGFEDDSILGNLINSVKDVGSSILDSLKDVLGIHSPSKEGEKIIDFLFAGMFKSFDGNEKTLKEVVQKAGLSILSNLDDELNSDFNLKNLFADLPTNIAVPKLSGKSHGQAQATVVNNYYYHNYTQNNTSPKALDELTIYRQSKNLLNLK